MTLSHDETKALIELVLTHEKKMARTKLGLFLLSIERREAEFYMGVIAHGPSRHSRSVDRYLRVRLDVSDQLGGCARNAADLSDDNACSEIR